VTVNAVDPTSGLVVPYGLIGRDIVARIGATQYLPANHESSTGNGELVIQDDSSMIWAIPDDVMEVLTGGDYFVDFIDVTEAMPYFMFRTMLPVEQGVMEVM
jgi:hypothetical protein